MLSNMSKVLKGLAWWWNQSLSRKYRLWFMIMMSVVTTHVMIGIYCFFWYGSSTIYRLDSMRALTLNHPISVRVISHRKHVENVTEKLVAQVKNDNHDLANKITAVKEEFIVEKKEQKLRSSVKNNEAIRKKISNTATKSTITPSVTKPIKQPVISKKIIDQQKITPKSVAPKKKIEPIASEVHSIISPTLTPLNESIREVVKSDLEDLFKESILQKQEEPLDLGRDDYEQLILKTDMLQAIARTWKPVEGLSKDLACTVLFSVDTQGVVLVEKIITPSQVRVFNATVVNALRTIVFVKQAWGKSFIYTFENK